MMKKNKSEREFTYDENGNVTESRTCDTRRSDGTCGGYDRKKTYEYDENGNLIREGVRNYVYDENGNKISTYLCNAYDSNGKCTKYGANQDYKYTYDENGNMISLRQCRDYGSNYASTGQCVRYVGYEYAYDANVCEPHCILFHAVNHAGYCRKMFCLVIIFFVFL